MLGLFLCVTLNVSEWHLTDDTLLVEQVLVARTIFIEQRSKNESVLNRSQSLPDQIWVFHKTFSLFFPRSQSLTRMRKPRVGSQTPSRKAVQSGIENPYPASEGRSARQRSFQIHTLRGDLFHRKEGEPCNISIAAAPACHSPRVTVLESRWTHHHELTKQHCAFLACHPLCAKNAYTDPILRKMWDNLSRTGKRKHTSAGLSSG